MLIDFINSPIHTLIGTFQELGDWKLIINNGKLRTFLRLGSSNGKLKKRWLMFLVKIYFQKNVMTYNTCHTT